MQKQTHLHISTIEREVGLPKDTLRAWERRYGFPQPVRDDNGERRYPSNQVQLLRLIKYLIDYGPRPGDIVGKNLEELQQIAVELQLVNKLKLDPHLLPYMNEIRAHRPARLRYMLQQGLAEHGLQRFVLDTVAPLNWYVGDAWILGDLQKFEEHLYIEQLQVVLRNAISQLRPTPVAPVVLLTSFPGEQHTPTLLIMESLLMLKGASCISLGTQTPLLDIVAAAQAHQSEIVALSFSTYYPSRLAIDDLRELRTLLPYETSLWAGGIGAGRIKRTMPGITLLKEPQQIQTALDNWHKGQELITPEKN